jgi:hypothetical protein
MVLLDNETGPGVNTTVAPPGILVLEPLMVWFPYTPTEPIAVVDLSVALKLPLLLLVTPDKVLDPNGWVVDNDTLRPVEEVRLLLLASLN